MNMDKKTIIAFVIIGLVIILTPYYMDLITPESVKLQRQAQQERARIIQDSLRLAQMRAAQEVQTREEEPVQIEKPAQKFEELVTSNERKIKIETPLYSAVISTKGGTIDSWIFKNYRHRNGNPYDLIETNEGNLALSFTDIEGDLVDTKDLNYSVRGFEDGGSDINYDLTSGSASETIELILNLGKNREIRKSLTFHYDKYYVDLSVKLINMDRYIDGREYDIYWGGGLGYSETGMDDDRYAKAYILLGADERVDVNAGTKNMGKRESFSGNTEWIAERTKYFSMAIIPKGTPGKGAYVIPQYEVIDKQQR